MNSIADGDRQTFDIRLRSHHEIFRAGHMCLAAHCGRQRNDPADLERCADGKYAKLMANASLIYGNVSPLTGVVVPMQPNREFPNAYQGTFSRNREFYSYSGTLRRAKTWNWQPRVEGAEAGLLKRIAIGLIGLCVLGGLGFLAFAWRSSITPIDPPAAAGFPRELLAKREALAGAGHCATCPTAKSGPTYARR